MTGAGGFLGARVIAQALARGDDVIGVGRSAHPKRIEALSNYPSCRYCAVDITRPGALAEVLAGSRADALVHAAAPGVSRRDAPASLELARQMVDGAIEVAAAVLKSCLPAIWIGSCFEYAPSRTAIAEAAPIAPDSAYGMAKALAYYAFSRLAASLPVVKLVPFHLYGPGENPERFVPTALLAAKGRAENAFGDESTTRDFVYVDDAADAVLRTCGALVARTLPQRLVLNVATGVGTTLGQAGKLAAAAAGNPGFLHHFAGAPPIHGYDPKFLVGDPRAAREVLGWEASTALGSGLARTWRHLSAGDDRCGGAR